METAEVEPAGLLQVAAARAMRLPVLLGMLAALPAAVSAPYHCDERYGDYRREPLIVVETKDCAGNVGLASFRADRVFKIETGNCRDPDDSDQTLYRVMLRILTGAGNYDVLWVDSKGVQAIREQLEENRQAALSRRECYRSAEQAVEEDQPEN